MGSITILLLPFFPVIYLIMFIGNLFGVSTGVNVTEVALPYNEESGLVWKCEKEDYGWFELTETKVDGDAQIFVFEAGTGESHCNKVVFTAQNGEELVYYARDVGPAFPIYGKVRLYAPDEYVIYDYVFKPEKKVENAYWSLTTSGTQSDDYCFGDTEVNGEAAMRVICFDGVKFTHSYRYALSTDEGWEHYDRVKVEYEFTKEKGLVINEYYS